MEAAKWIFAQNPLHYTFTLIASQRVDDATGETWRTVYSAADDPKSIPHSLDANGAGGEEEDAKEKLSNFYLNKISISPFLWDHPQP